jgi:hypothetical protein
MSALYWANVTQKLLEFLRFIGPIFLNYGAILFDLKIHGGWIKEMIENRQERISMRPCY